MLQWAPQRDVTVANVILLTVVEEYEKGLDGSLPFLFHVRLWLSWVMGEKWSQIR